MDFDLYHDESMIGGYWHGMLLIPTTHRMTIAAELELIRENTGYSDPLGIKRISRSGKILDCAQGWISIAIASMCSKVNAEPIPVFMGNKERGQKTYSLLKGTRRVKFILFKQQNSHQDMYRFADHAKKIELTFAMGLKGGMHFLGDEEDSIEIKRIHFDGHEHYRRNISREHILSRLQGLRSYCSIQDSHNLIDDRRSDHRKPNSQDYVDCQFLQLTDLLIGAFRTSLGFGTNNSHRVLSMPAKALVSRYRLGVARMKNSRWNKSFCISACRIDNGAWKFDQVESIQSNDGYQPMLLHDV